MFLLTTSSNGSRGSGFQRRPLTPAEAPPVSCTVRMGALCWVLPEEDEEVLEEGGGAGVLRKPLETSCWKNPGNGLIIQVTRRGRGGGGERGSCCPQVSVLWCSCAPGSGRQLVLLSQLFSGFCGEPGSWLHFSIKQLMPHLIFLGYVCLKTHQLVPFCPLAEPGPGLPAVWDHLSRRSRSK